MSPNPSLFRACGAKIHYLISIHGDFGIKNASQARKIATLDLYTEDFAIEMRRRREKNRDLGPLHKGISLLKCAAGEPKNPPKFSNFRPS